MTEEQFRLQQELNQIVKERLDNQDEMIRELKEMIQELHKTITAIIMLSPDIMRRL